MNLFGWSAIALLGVGLHILGWYWHRDSDKVIKNASVVSIFAGSACLSLTAFGSWMAGFGATGGVLAFLALLFCAAVFYRDVVKDKRADKRAAVAAAIAPFVFALGIAQMPAAAHTVGGAVQAKFSQPLQQHAGR